MLSPTNNATWLKVILGFALGAGTAVAATYNTFELQTAHATDVLRIELQRQNDRDELYRRLHDLELKIDRLPQVKN